MLSSYSLQTSSVRNTTYIVFVQTVSDVDVKSSKFYKAWVPLGFGSTAYFAGFYLK